MKVFAFNRIIGYFLATFLGLSAINGYATFYRFDLYHKAITDKKGKKQHFYRYFLADVHYDYKDGSTKYTQQSHIIKFLQWLQKHNRSVMLAVEEMDHYAGTNKQVRANIQAMVTRDRASEKENIRHKNGAKKYAQRGAKTGMDGITSLAQQHNIPVINVEFRHACPHDIRETVADHNKAFNMVAAMHKANSSAIPQVLYKQIQEDYTYLNKTYGKSFNRPLNDNDRAFLHRAQSTLMDALIYYLMYDHEQKNCEHSLYLFGGKHFHEQTGVGSIENYMQHLGYTKICSQAYPMNDNVQAMMVDLAKEFNQVKKMIQKQSSPTTKLPERNRFIMLQALTKLIKDFLPCTFQSKH